MEKYPAEASELGGAVMTLDVNGRAQSTTDDEVEEKEESLEW